MSTEEAVVPRTTTGRSRQRADLVVTGWHLRGLLLVTCLLAVITVVQGETAQRLGAVSVVGTVVVVAGTVLLPGTAMSTGFLLVLSVAMLDREDPAVLRLVLAAALLHAVHLLAGLCTLGTLATRFEVGGLLPTARRWALAQAIALPVVLTVWLVGRSSVLAAGVSETMEVAAGVIAVLLVFGTVALARRTLR